MVRLRHAWLLALTVFVDAPAGAMPAPRPEWEEIHERNQSTVKDALARVSAEFAGRGEFKIIQVKFRYSLHKEFSPVLASNRVGFDRKQWWRVEGALRPLGLEPMPEKNSDWFWSQRELDLVEEFALGDPKALFPAGLLAAWQRAGWGQRPVEAALRSMLPPDVDVTPDGCLRLNGSEPLSQALQAWLGRTLGPPVSAYNEYEVDYALADAWWLRHTTAHHDPDLIAREKICLEKVDAVSGTLRRHRNDIERVDGYGGRTIHAEWVVDAQGNMVGELGFCRQTQAGERGDLSAEAAAHRKNLEAVVRPIAFGPAPGFRRIVLDWGPYAHLSTSVHASKEPITLDLARIAARCDPRTPLTCTRQPGERPELGGAVGDALFRCINEASVDTRTVSVSFDLSPDGVPENVVARGTSSAGPLPAPTLRCFEAVFNAASYSRSEGGPCAISRSLDALIEP